MLRCGIAAMRHCGRIAASDSAIRRIGRIGRSPAPPAPPAPPARPAATTPTPGAGDAATRPPTPRGTPKTRAKGPQPQNPLVLAHAGTPPYRLPARAADPYTRLSRNGGNR